jgi:hypothetical protein
MKLTNSFQNVRTSSLCIYLGWINFMRRRLNLQNSQLRGELPTPRYTRHIYRCSAALRWCIVKKTNGEHNRESSLFNKFCLKHIDLLVFELTGNRQRQTFEYSYLFSVSTATAPLPNSFHLSLLCTVVRRQGALGLFIFTQGFGSQSSQLAWQMPVNLVIYLY